MTATTMPIPVDLVHPNPHQPRREFDPAALQELADSIKQVGLIQPITVEPVYPTGDAEITYLLHDGERRLRAARLAGLDTIPAYIVTAGADAQSLLIRAVVANLQRTDLNPIELAQAYQQLADSGLTDKDIAAQVSKSRSTVANARRLLNLPVERRQQVAAGQLSERQATALVTFHALPAATQDAILHTWEGKGLAEPEKLTSDEIRQKQKNAISHLSTAIDAWQLDDALPGDNIHQPRCTGCPHLITAGHAPRCLHAACHTAKTHELKRRILAAASESTGIKWLDPAHPYSPNKYGGFRDNGPTGGDNQVLDHALTHQCENLRLEYYYLRGDTYCKPADQNHHLRYICLHPGNGEKTCHCRQAIHADALKKEKADKAEISRLTDTTINAIAAALQQVDLPTLRLLAHHLLNRSDDKLIRTGDIDKLAYRLAKTLVERQTGWQSTPESCRLALAAWLTPLGFTVGDGGEQQLLSLVDQLNRIWDWAKNLRSEYGRDQKLKQLAGNLTNLATLAAEAAALPDTVTDQLTHQYRYWPRLDTLKTALLQLQPIVTDPALEWSHISPLVIWENIAELDKLTEVQQPVTLTLALALLPLFADDDHNLAGRRQALEQRRAELLAPEQTLIGQHLAAVEAELDQITAHLADDQSYAILKQYRTRLQEIFSQQLDIPDTTPDHSKILIHWDALTDELDRRLKNFNYRPLSLETVGAPTPETAQ